MRAGVKSIDNALRDIRGRQKDTSFADTLTSVRQKLEKLPISAFRDTDSEAIAIMSLKRLIEKKFVPLAQRRLGLDK